MGSDFAFLPSWGRMAINTLVLDIHMPSAQPWALPERE